MLTIFYITENTFSTKETSIGITFIYILGCTLFISDFFFTWTIYDLFVDNFNHRFYNLEIIYIYPEICLSNMQEVITQNTHATLDK
jgi:hypothetical protein